MSEISSLHKDRAASKEPKKISVHKEEESDEHRMPRIETELVTKDHSYRKDKLSYRSGLDLFYKSHSESAYKKDKEHFIAFNKDNSEYHDKKDRLENAKPVKANSSNGPMNYGQYEKALRSGKEMLTPKEKSKKFQFLKRRDSEHSCGSRYHIAKPLSIERSTSTYSPLISLDLESSQKEANNFEWSNLLMNSKMSQVKIEQLQPIAEHNNEEEKIIKQTIYQRYNPGRGDIYKGTWKEGKADGKGMFSIKIIGVCAFANGEKYDGLWKENRLHGKGKTLFKIS